MLESYFKEFDFKPLNDYVDKLEKEIVDVKKIDLDSRFNKERFNVLKCNLKSDFDLEIHIAKPEDIGSEICFYFLKDGNIVEMIDFYIYDFELSKVLDERFEDKHLEEGANRNIYHEYWMKDGNKLTVYSSIFNYKNNGYMKGFESVRNLLYQEFRKKLSDEVLNNMFVPLRQVDLNNVPTTFKYDDVILDEPTINNFSINGISYESNYLKRLNELLKDTSLKDRYEEKKNNSSHIMMEETNGFIDTHETRYTSPDEYYKVLKKSKSSIRKDLK